MTVKYDTEISEIKDYYDATDLCDVEDDNYEVEYTQFSQWGNKINGQITIHNLSDNMIEDWRLEMKSNVDIEQIWNADVVEKDVEQEYYYLENKSYNQNIPANGSISFGFIASYDSAPEFSDYALSHIVQWDETPSDEEVDEEEEEYYDGEILYGEEDFDTLEEYYEYLKSTQSFAAYSFRSTRTVKSAAKISVEKIEEYQGEARVNDVDLFYTIKYDENDKSIDVWPKKRLFRTL